MVAKLAFAMIVLVIIIALAMIMVYRYYNESAERAHEKELRQMENTEKLFEREDL